MFRSVGLTRFIVALALTAAAASAAQAQEQERRRRGGEFGFGGGTRAVGSAMLLRNEKVQKELEISTDQQAQVDKLLTESREKSRELFSGLRDLTEEQRRAKFEELREKGQAIADDVNKQLAGILSETQNKRLEEIGLQLRGSGALQDDAIASKLEVTDEQKQKIRDLMETQRDMQRELFGSSNLRDLSQEERRSKFEELRKKGEELRAETDKAVLETLTEAQRSKLEQLKGKPVDIDRQELFRGAFGRPGGEGGFRRPGGENGASRQPGRTRRSRSNS